MKYLHYVKVSSIIFTVSFIIGSLINNFFKNLQKKFERSYKYAMLFGSTHLICIITIAFGLHNMYPIEPYAPHVLFSSFMISLQSNMIDNFREFLKI